MRLTTRGRYAVTAMLDLALNAKFNPVSLSDISHRQGISLSYLEQLFAKLRHSNLVKSVRGPGGGYMLAHNLAQIAIVHVIDAVDEKVDARRCHGSNDCQAGDACLTHHLWCDLSDRIHDFLSNISLEDLVMRQEIQEIAKRQQHKLEELKANEIPLASV